MSKSVADADDDADAPVGPSARPLRQYYFKTFAAYPPNFAS